MFTSLIQVFSISVSALSGFLYSRLLIVLLLATGLWFTIRTRFVQLRLLPESLRVVREKPGTEGATTSFQALMVSTASRVGTGNIVGISVALCAGGYGAVFWMWVIALIGGASAFIESTLAQIYKRRAPDGSSYGGPAYYIEAALNSRFLACLFCVCLIATYAGGFNMLASFNLQSTFSGYGFYNPKVTPWVIGGILGLLVGWCLMGGGRRITRVTAVLVPLMGTSYILLALAVVGLNLHLLPRVLSRIFAEAFDFRAIFAGFSGSCMMHGIKRGLFSNEAGVGSAPNAAASADVSHPVKQGLVQMLSVFLDTLVLCTATAFLLLCSGVEPEVSLQGAPYVQSALQNVLGASGPVFITVAMVLFAFTTLLGNLYYCDNCLSFLLGHAPSPAFLAVFRVLASLIIVLGAGMEIGLVWDIADVLMGLMALINLPVILRLGASALAALQNYMSQKEQGLDPVFLASEIDLDDRTDFWT